MSTTTNTRDLKQFQKTSNFTNAFGPIDLTPLSRLPNMTVWQRRKNGELADVQWIDRPDETLQPDGDEQGDEDPGDEEVRLYGFRLRRINLAALQYVPPFVKSLLANCKS